MNESLGTSVPFDATFICTCVCHFGSHFPISNVIVNIVTPYFAKYLRLILTESFKGRLRITLYSLSHQIYKY